MNEIAKSGRRSARETEWQLGRALVICDADDTLWFTEELYDSARDHCRKIVEGEGFDGEAWETLERTIDIRNVSRFGLRSIRFPMSCVDAYQILAGKSVRSAVSSAVRAAAEEVFLRVAPSAPGVPEVLEKLSQEFRLVLLTQGEAWVQERRLHEAGLDGAFSQVVIVPEKTTVVFKSIVRDDGRPVGQAWSVGNSLASDINPALRIGMNAIWIPAHVWEHEKREAILESDALHKASSLSAAKDILLAGN